jgi:hypothetical protein
MTASLIDERFVAYLEDHLVGSEAALTVARRLRRRHAHEEIGDVMETIVPAIEREQQVVRDVISFLRPTAERVSVSGLIGTVAAGATTVLTVLRRSLPEPVPSVLEDLESLAIGVWGKRLLWGALMRMALADPRVEELDPEGLAREAEEQERLLLRLRDDELDRLLA